MNDLCEVEILNLFSFWQPPKQSDRAQVQSREVRLPDSSPISLDEQDVQIVSIGFIYFFVGWLLL